MNELYSLGILDEDELEELNSVFRVRNQVVHGCVLAKVSDEGMILRLCEFGRRLIQEARMEKQPA